MAEPMTFTIKNMDELTALMKKLGESVKGGAKKDAVEAGLRVIEGNAVVNIEKKFSSASTGGLAANRSIEVKDEGGKAVGTLAFHSNHAMIQEMGGVIKPVSAQFLAIPKNASARKVGSPRNYPEALHFVGGGNGGVLMDSSNSVIYVLTKAVTIPPRPFLRPAMDEHQAEIENAIGAVLKKAIEENANGND
jgi:HK97 gp10 family phage protein